MVSMPTVPWAKTAPVTGNEQVGVKSGPQMADHDPQVRGIRKQEDMPEKQPSIGPYRRDHCGLGLTCCKLLPTESQIAGLPKGYSWERSLWVDFAHVGRRRGKGPERLIGVDF